MTLKKRPKKPPKPAPKETKRGPSTVPNLTKKKRIEQQQLVVRLWRNGIPIDDMADRVKTDLGTTCTADRCRGIIDNRIRQLGGLVSEHNRIKAWIAEQILRIVRAFGDAVDKGDPDAARVLLAAMDRLSKITGVEAAAKHLIGTRNLDDMSEDELIAFLGGEPTDSEVRAAASPAKAGEPS